MNGQGGGRGRGGGGRGKPQFRKIDPNQLGFNAAPPGQSSSQPCPSSSSSHPTHPLPSNLPKPFPTPPHHKPLDSFRGRLLSVLCMHPVIATNELPRAYQDKYKGSMPDHRCLGFGSLTEMLAACPNECIVAVVPSGPVTRQYVQLAPHWARLRDALEQRRGELIAANEQVTCAKLLGWLEKKMNRSLSDLGLHPPDRFPYLLDLRCLEQSVEVCIGCYMTNRLLAATLWDLEKYICGLKGVNCFDELRLGPLISNYVVQYLFRPTFSGHVVPQVSISHVAAALRTVKQGVKSIVRADDIERELCRAFRVPSQHHLGVVIPEGTSLGWAVKCLGRAKEKEELAINAEYACRAEAIQMQARAHAEAQRAQLSNLALEYLVQELYWELVNDPIGLEAARQQAKQRLGMLAQKPLDNEGQLGQDSNESAHVHSKVSLKDLVATVQRLGAGLGTSFAALADLERRVLAHYEGVQHFGALCEGAPSMLQLLEQQPTLAAVLASSEDGGPAQGGLAVAMGPLLRAIAQATDAYCATHQNTAHDERQPDEESWVAQAICMQYNVRSVEQLGRGSLCELMALSQDWRHADSLPAARNVHAVSALVCGQQCGAEGALDRHSGEDMRSMACAALRSAPLLTDLAQWTQWSAVFKDAVGSLDSELLDEAMDEWSVLELPSGQLVKVPNTTNMKADFKESLVHLDPVATVATLLGYAAQVGNCSPVVLEPLVVHISERMRDERKFTGSDDAREILAGFVLQCLHLIPSVLRPTLAQHMFLTALTTEVMDGDVRATAQHLLRCADASHGDRHLSMDERHTSLVDQRSHLLPMLHALGMQLKLNDLQDHYVEAVWRSGQVAAQSAKAAVGIASAATAVSASPLDALSPLNSTGSAQAAAGDAMELLPESLRAHFVDSVQAAPGPEGAAGQVRQQGVTAVDQRAAQTFLQPEQADAVAATREEQEALDVIYRLRTEEFGLVDEQHMTHDKKKDIERQGDMLSILSKELYSEAVHFQMELVQNADDNYYAPDTCPLLEFKVQNDRIFIKNNELGFAAENVGAICSVGKSTKKNKKGFTGEKGIGFKSVFKVTDKPAIHSNHFHFAFDLTIDDKLGYIVPSPVPSLPLELHNPKEVTTCIELPLKEEFQGKGPESQKLREKFNNLKPVLLLFLRKLRHIRINDEVRQSFQTIMAERDSVFANCLRLRSVRWSLAKGGLEEDSSSRWMYVSKIVEPRNLRHGEKVEETCVSVAYVLPSGADDRELPERQPVYAFLPVRSYGLKFVVNANWEVPPSRELVYDNAFNHELRDHIPELAMEALSRFQRLPPPREGRPFFWTDWWLKTLPLEGEVDEPFKAPARRLRMMAKREPCIPTESNLLVRPEQAHVCVDDGVRALLAEERTQRLLDVHFVHPDIHCLYNSSRLCEQLRVREFATSDLLSLARRVCAEPALLQKLGLPWLTQLLCCVFADVHEWTPQQRKQVLAGVRSLPILPLADGSFVSMAQLEQESVAASPPASASASSSPRLVFFAMECLVQEVAAAQALASAQEAATENAKQGGAEGQGAGTVDRTAADTQSDTEAYATGGTDGEPPAPAQESMASLPKLPGVEAASMPLGRGVGPDRASSTSSDAQDLMHACGLDWRQMRMRQVHPLLLQVKPSQASKLKRGLSMLGVKEITAADIARHHVLPMFRHHQQQLQQAQQAQQLQEAQQVQHAADQEGTWQQLEAALAFVLLSGLMQDQSIYQPLRACAVVVTNEGLFHIPDAPYNVYLPPILGNNVVDLQANFPSHKWVLVDPSYASSSAAACRIDKKQWAYLFTLLGAHKWLPLEQNKHDLDQAGWQQHLAAAAAAGIPCTSCAPGTAGDGMGMGDVYARLHDVSCPEFERLVESITNAWKNPPLQTPSGSAAPLTQFMHLAKQMETQWQSGPYAASMAARVTLSAAAAAEVEREGIAGVDCAGSSGAGGCEASAAVDHCPSGNSSRVANQPVCMEVPTSFALCMRTCEWLLSSNDKPTRPMELFLESGYKSWLHGLVLYLNQKRPEKITDRSFLSALGVHMQLDLTEALALLTHWATRDNNSSPPTTTSATIPTLGLTGSSIKSNMREKPTYVAPDGSEVPEFAMAELGGSGAGCDGREGAGRDGARAARASSCGAQELMGNRLRTSLDQMGTLYAFIWEKVQHRMGLQALVVAFFAKYPLLWMPDKKAEPPSKVRAEEGAFYSIACARHEDKARAMEAVPWERQQLRISVCFYKGADQLFKNPLWRPTPTSLDNQCPTPQDHQGTTSGNSAPAPLASGALAGVSEPAEADGYPDGAEEGSESDVGGSEGVQDGDERAGDGSDSDDDDDDGKDEDEKGAEDCDGAEQQQQQQQQQVQQEQQGEEQHWLVAGSKMKLIQETPSLSEYVQALQGLADSCQSEEMPYETARHYVIRVFKMASIFLKERRPGRFQVSGAELRSLIAPHVFGGATSFGPPKVFPSSHRTFVSLQDNLLINDDPQLFKHFKSLPHIHFLHISEAERKPKEPKDSLHMFLHVVGVPQLSTAVHPVVHRDASTFNPFHLQYTIYRALLLAQRFLFFKKRGTSRTYEDLKQAGISRLLTPPGKCPFKVVAAEKLQVQYVLQQQNAGEEPAVSPRLPCEAVLFGNKDLYVNEKASSFDTQQVAQELSRLFHPTSVSTVLSAPPGTAELPPAAPKRDDLTIFLDAVLQRFKTGSKREVEEYMSKRECFELPEGEEPWAELPTATPSPAPTPPPMVTGVQASSAGVIEEIADDVESHLWQQQQQQQQEQQQQGQQVKRAPHTKHQFNSDYVWASLRPPGHNRRAGMGGAGLDGNCILMHERGGVVGEEEGGGALREQGDSTVEDEEGSVAAAALRAEKEREARAEMLRQRDHQHAVFGDGQVEDRTESSIGRARGLGDRRGGEGLTGHVNREGPAERTLAASGCHLSRESVRDAGKGEQPHMQESERHVEACHPSQARTEPHTGAPLTHHHRAGHAERGDDGVCAPSDAPLLHTPRPATEQGSLFGRASGSPTKGTVVWKSSAEAEEAARRHGLLLDFDPNQVLDVLRHAQGPSGVSLLDAFPHATTTAPFDSPKYLELVGSWGERTAVAWIRAKTEDPNTTVEWMNEACETGLPYDILVTDLADTSKKVYVEVKTSKSISKDSFPISRNELEFAALHGDAYRILRLQGAGAPKPRMSQIVNPVQLWTEGAVSVEMSSASHSSPVLVGSGNY